MNVQRTALCWAVLLLLLAVYAPPAPCTPVGGPVASQVADLKDQLEKGLKARRPEEFQFIAMVVAMVEEGRLPLELVKSTFQWARRKAKTKRYPFPYFERALRQRAAKLGIKI